MRCTRFRRARPCTASGMYTFTTQRRRSATWATRRGTSAHTDITERWFTELAIITGRGLDLCITTRALTRGDSMLSTIRGPAGGDLRWVTARPSSTLVSDGGAAITVILRIG